MYKTAYGHIYQQGWVIACTHLKKGGSMPKTYIQHTKMNKLKSEIYEIS